MMAITVLGTGAFAAQSDTFLGTDTGTSSTKMVEVGASSTRGEIEAATEQSALGRSKATPDAVKVNVNPAQAEARTAKALPKPDGDVETADDLISDYMALQEGEPDVDSTDKQQPAPVQETAIGAARGEIQARVAEYANEGLLQVGQAEVLDVRVVERDSKLEFPEMTVEACIDISNIDVVDSNGESLGDRLYQPEHPIRDIYVMRFANGAWKIASHSVPVDDKCTP